jgi:hypothetical protein
MEKILFIEFEDILHNVTISGNLDEYKILPHVYNSQILYLEPILGSELYKKFEDIKDIITGETYIDYYYLLVEYIIPSVCNHTMELFIPFNSFDINNGGTYQHNASNATYSPFDDIDRIVNKYRAIGTKYDDKLVKYLCENSTLFTEYTSNTGLIDKTETTIKTGWFLGLGNSGSKIRR